MDVHRLTLLHFSVSGLAILNESPLSDAQHFINFIYAHQIPPSKEFNTERCGFRGSSFIGVSLNFDANNASHYSPLPYDSCHITMNYSALVSLLVLGDDLERVNRQAVIDGIKALQSVNGNLVNGSLFCPEFDARFIFSAVASAYILDMLEQLNLDAFEKFLVDSITYEGAFGSLPKMEAHAGLTYCALASLKLMDRLDKVLPRGSFQRDKLIKWLLCRQNGGFNGRCQKEADTCYTFWVGASLRMLDAHQYVDKTSLLKFICSTYDPIVGGFTKAPDADNVDLLHSYMTLAGLSCLFKNPASTNSTEPTPAQLANSFNKLHLGEAVASDLVTQLDQLVVDDMRPLVPELNLPVNTFQHLMEIHANWRSPPSQPSTSTTSKCLLSTVE
ncbi:Geranylgeranyl transferase type-1 subunit beta [Echinococcus granulosus]|uniref:Geranylgeranyl transferase type-1 subunit beta n=1 Tax=Echinococcus granulosus TaxID=6210 RepID=W6UKP7_ECHGR|nr:Geranylgeranyl transferase type-1 subunit beta [Echinococcus granulosus]EUB62110.1 Geranylgeranyl transferase type-1 subunit beta [Echinococcus granulosus]KAH9285602.1 Geranylgeranyl transferase type-1 subunit beta [Echinococcus granulosus]